MKKPDSRFRSRVFLFPYFERVIRRPKRRAMVKTHIKNFLYIFITSNRQNVIIHFSICMGKEPKLDRSKRFLVLKENGFFNEKIG